MPEYYYQIKGRNPEGYWCWPPIATGLITADTSKLGRKQLEEEYGLKLPGASNKSNDNPLLLTLIDVAGKPYLSDRFLPKVCTQCSGEYTLNAKYMVNRGGHSEFCCIECHEKYQIAKGIVRNLFYDFDGIHPAVIYKILNKTTGKCYIGKTTQAFTLRWYQHFFQGTGTKFFEAIKSHEITDWTFEVIEKIKVPINTGRHDKHKFILEREMYWMQFYNSINDGYNTTPSLKTEDADTLKLEFINEDL